MKDFSSFKKTQTKFTPVLVYGFIDVEDGSDQVLDEEELTKIGLSLYTNGVYEDSRGLTPYWPVYGISVEPGEEIDKSIKNTINRALKFLTGKYSIDIDNIEVGFFNAIKIEDDEGNIGYGHLDDYFKNSDYEIYDDISSVSDSDSDTSSDSIFYHPGSCSCDRCD